MQNKDRVLKLIEIFRNESEESKPLTTGEIIMLLEREGLQVERKTLYNDINTLIDNGYNIVKVTKNHSNAYYLVESDFDIAELKILFDAISSTRFISKRKTDILNGKLLKYAGKNKGELIKRNSVCFDTVKHNNNKILIYTDILNEAIIEKKKVSFNYFDLNIKLEKVYRHDNKLYVVNPVTLVFSEGFYYLVCFSDEYESYINFRVDKMDNVEMLDKEISKAKSAEDFSRFTRPSETFSMFHGELKRVTMLCANFMANIIIDKFGEKIKMTKVDDEHFEFTAPLQVSNPFFAWCFTFRKELKITAPQSVVDGYRQMLKEVFDFYN